MAAETGKSNEPGRKTFSLVSWNIDGLYQHDTFERTATVVETLAKLHPDVIYIQEIIPTTWDMLTHAFGATHHCLANNPAERYFHGIFVAKKEGIQLSEPLVVSKFPGTRMDRHLLHQVVTIGQQPIHLFTSHLESMESDRPERKRQLRQVFEEMRKLAEGGGVSIFAGDLNVFDVEIESVGLPPGCVDAWEECGADPTKKYTWDMSANNNRPFPEVVGLRRRLDRLYLCQSEPTKVRLTSFDLIGQERIQSCGRFPSDHWGVLTQFELVDV